MTEKRYTHFKVHTCVKIERSEEEKAILDKLAESGNYMDNDEFTTEPINYRITEYVKTKRWPGTGKSSTK